MQHKTILHSHKSIDSRFSLFIYLFNIIIRYRDYWLDSLRWVKSLQAVRRHG